MNRESDLDINLDFLENEVEQDIPIQEQPEQRTEQWFKQRSFCYTGSKGKTIMACSSKGSKMSWDNPDKINEFSSGIISYIYETAMQRKTNRYIKSASTSEMKYGTMVEPLIERRSREHYFNSKQMIRVPVGFKEFPNRPYAGASTDDIITKNDEIIAVVENKACTSWNTHYKRTYENTDESSTDFWQTQMEMIAWEVDLCYYVVISPPTDINKYVYYDGDIMDLYDEWVLETEMTIEEIKRSPIHCDALLKRIDIMEAVTNRFLQTNEKIDVILYGFKSGEYILHNPSNEPQEVAKRAAEGESTLKKINVKTEENFGIYDFSNSEKGKGSINKLFKQIAAEGTVLEPKTELPNDLPF